MAQELTPRMKLIKESDDELIDQFEYNWPILDKYSDSQMVNDGATPVDSDLYEGCLVAERTSGKLWMAVVNPNPAPPVYVKSWISYPWSIGATKVEPWNNANTEQGFTGIIADGQVNSSAADLVGGKINIPINGIYAIEYNLSVPNTGGRSFTSSLSFNGTPNFGTELVDSTSGIGITQLHWEGNMYLSASDKIGWSSARFGGVTGLSITMRCYVSMICPTYL
jgi:hypothetical protein